MVSQTYRGVVRGGTVVLLEELPLADGTEVVVTPVAHESGSAAAVLAAVDAPPHVPPAWVDELERLIAEGQRPPSRDDPFAETPSDGEGR